MGCSWNNLGALLFQLIAQNNSFLLSRNLFTVLFGGQKKSKCMLTCIFYVQVNLKWIADTHQFMISKLKQAIVINMLLNQLFQSILVNIDSFFFTCSSVHKAAKRKNLTNISPNHIDLKLVQRKTWPISSFIIWLCFTRTGNYQFTNLIGWNGHTGRLQSRFSHVDWHLMFCSENITTKMQNYWLFSSHNI